MNKFTFFTILLIAIITATSGCAAFDKIVETRPTLTVNYVIDVTNSIPTIDTDKTTRSVEEEVLLKQARYDMNVELPAISSSIFYNQNKISYSTGTKYHGPGNYTLKYAFIDGKPLPASSDEAVVVMVVISDINGNLLNKEYISIRWA
ncbi:MAG: hypothetical protein KAJ03_03675 [Gammaproteobacteria bacterium]|nr:hypothetical protein [Gammaproteobacteria bacterium]